MFPSLKRDYTHKKDGASLFIFMESGGAYDGNLIPARRPFSGDRCVQVWGLIQSTQYFINANVSELIYVEGEVSETTRMDNEFTK